MLSFRLRWQLEKKKEARADRFGLNEEKKRRLDRAKRFNLETSDVVRACIVGCGSSVSVWDRCSGGAGVCGNAQWLLFTC